MPVYDYEYGKSHHLPALHAEASLDGKQGINLEWPKGQFTI